MEDSQAKAHNFHGRWEKYASLIRSWPHNFARAFTRSSNRTALSSEPAFAIDSVISFWPSWSTVVNLGSQSPAAISTARQPRNGHGVFSFTWSRHLVLRRCEFWFEIKECSQHLQPSLHRPTYSAEKLILWTTLHPAQKVSLQTAKSTASTDTPVYSNDWPADTTGLYFVPLMPWTNLSFCQYFRIGFSSSSKCRQNSSMASHRKLFNEKDHVSNSLVSSARLKQVAWNLSLIVGKRNSFSIARNPSKTCGHLELLQKVPILIDISNKWNYQISYQTTKSPHGTNKGSQR